MLKCKARQVKVPLTGNFPLTAQFVHVYQIFRAISQDLCESVVGTQNGHEVLLQSSIVAGTTFERYGGKCFVLDLTPSDWVGRTWNTDKIATYRQKAFFFFAI
jgi:hypothetical protein